MKQKKIIAAVVVAVIVLACVGISQLDLFHSHSFGEWETQTPASCESAEIEVRRCECGKEETREGDPATGHAFVDISAESLMETPMEGMVVTAEDLKVTGTCQCGANVVITEGIELEGAALVLGENTVTVRYGALSATLTVQAEKMNITLEAVVSDDTYVSSGSKDKDNSAKKDMSAKADSYRIYFRANISEILGNELFTANKDNAKVQLSLAVTGGSVTEETVFTLKVYDPTLPESDTDFSKLTWNSVDNKEGALGTYMKLHWNNGTELVSDAVGHNVAAGDGRIVVTLAYSQIADFVDKDGNILFAFATKNADLKVGALENEDETKRPVLQVVLDGEHFHVFDQEVAEREYFVSANCKEKAKYHLSCSCGAAGTEIFEHGGVIAHTYGELIPKVEKTCATDGMRAHYRCTACQKYFYDKDGQKVATSADSLIIPADHTYGKLMAQKDATCTEDGMKARYKCDKCKKFFDENKVETTEDALKIQKLGHTYGELVPRKEKTCTEDGMKEHYRCTVCQKYFVEKDGKKVVTSAESLKISAGHEYKLVQKQQDPTCTKHGWNKYYKCDACGKYFDADKNETTKEAQRIPALGHTYGELIPQKDATCTEDGMKAHYRCSVCGTYFDENMVETTEDALKIPAAHKTKVIVKTDPTCTKDGNNRYYQCTICKKYFVDKAGTEETTKEAQKIPALGHNMVMKWDETHHWTECAAGCGEKTDREAHHGGTATETEKAKCETCGQPYGE